MMDHERSPLPSAQPETRWAASLALGATAEERRAALDRVALENLRTVAPIGAALFALVALTKPYALSMAASPVTPAFVLVATAWEGGTSLLLLGLHFAVQRKAIPARWANATLAAVAAVILMGSFFQMVVLKDVLRTAAFMLLLLAGALFVTSRRWFAGMVAASLAMWLFAVVLSLPIPGVVLLGSVVVEAAAMALIVFVARYRTISKLESMRIVEAKRARILEETVVALARAEDRVACALLERETIFETVPDLIYQLDAQTRLVAWNKRVEQVTGLRADELKNRPCAEFVEDRERPIVAAMIQACIATGAVEQEFHLLRRDGPPALYQFRKAAIRDSRGEVVGFAGVGRDISEQRRAERRLAAQHAATSVLAAGGPEVETLSHVLRTTGNALGWQLGAVWIVSPEADALHCVATWREQDEPSEFEAVTRSRSFTRGVGLPGQVWVSAEPHWVEDFAESEFPRAALARQEGLHGAFGFPIKRADETIGAIEFYSERPEKPDAELLRMMATVGSQVGLFLDRKHAEERIWKLNAQLQERVQELATANRDLESFSYTVSHDLRAPLRAIRQYANLIEEEGATHPEESRLHLDRIQQAAVRMGEIIEDLLELSRADRGLVRRQDVDVTAMTRAIGVELQSREPARRVDLVVPDGLHVHADPGLLRVVFENLIGNAWKFTRPAPHPRVEVGILDHGRERILFVRDNGAGFDMAKAERLFRPFQRLHSEKAFEGTGVGLATVQRIVARHGGRAWAESAPGEGATFYFTLEPPTPAPAKRPVERATSAS